MFSRDVNAFLQVLFDFFSEFFFFYLFIFYKLSEVFSAPKMKIMTEVSKLMSEDQFNVRKGPYLKMQSKHAFLRPVFR